MSKSADTMGIRLFLKSALGTDLKGTPVKMNCSTAEWNFVVQIRQK